MIARDLNFFLVPTNYYVKDRILRKFDFKAYKLAKNVLINTNIIYFFSGCYWLHDIMFYNCYNYYCLLFIITQACY